MSSGHEKGVLGVYVRYLVAIRDGELGIIITYVSKSPIDVMRWVIFSNEGMSSSLCIFK